ncbi:hypothetical protein Y032_0440g1507 [Ancylostoma ceylanicum]|uniref:SCP domain-containing protein n=2 Tax=Ancylostoma ceylanicum TaxID=53326 RepID=A0A016X1F4_9BILA|nr:hypothetical protein Y032_0440g1507 [Ancylostoma ceylanicum]
MDPWLQPLIVSEATAFSTIVLHPEMITSYCRIKSITEPPTSTMCPNAATTDAKWITDDFRKTAVGMHNYYRRLLATGWAEDKKLGYAKWASSMPELEYSCESEDEIMKELKNCAGKEVANTKAQANNYKFIKEYETPDEQVLQKVDP